jgi:two-component system, NtrC family, response regulator GlrR
MLNPLPQGGISHKLGEFKRRWGMALPRIVIIDTQHLQSLGTHVHAILQGERRYRVDLLAKPSLDGMAQEDRCPALFIPVLPVTQEQADPWLATLQAHAANAPVLPVLKGVELATALDGLLHKTPDFLIAPLRAAEVRARVRRLLSGSHEPARERGRERQTALAGLVQLVGEDPTFLAVKRKLPLLARSEAPVLLTGETGTGKELCARALHYLSRRAGKPFLPVNCGAIPVELFERELFGHAKGAFTSAWAAQPGLIAEAEGGTLFLDEIETLPPGAQVKLLRFLQDHTYQALGSPKPRQADLRIIAATNQELTHKVRDGTFREDLFYRLAVITLTLPPLRERRGDIPLLAAQLLARYVDQHGGGSRQWSRRAMDALCQYAWPGNIRELANVVQQVAVLTDTPIIELEDLPLRPIPPAQAISGTSFQQAKSQVLAQFEQAYCMALLRQHQGNVTQAARAAQMERRTFGRLIKKYGIAKH